MTVTAKLVRDTETRTVDTLCDAETGACKVEIKTIRKVTLRLTGAPAVVGRAPFLPDTLTLHFKDGALTDLAVFGGALRKDGQAGEHREDAVFRADGSRLLDRSQLGCPAEIMDIVRRYVA